MTKYKPSRDLPAFVREEKTFSPTKLRDTILAQRNTAVTPESITMWFKRHAEVYAQLRREIVDEELPNEVIGDTIFQDGTFEELPTVKQWLQEMEDRDLRKNKIKQNIRALKRICLGQFTTFKLDLVKEGVWCYKHPDRLTLEDAQEIIRILKRKGFETAGIRLPLRNFLMSKGVVVGKKISGAKGKGFGSLARLFVKKETLTKILEWIRDLNFEAYCADLFMFKTGTRLMATLNALIENIRVEGDYVEIKVFDKGRKSKYPEGKPWDKYIPPDLWQALKQLIGDRKAGLIFNIDKTSLSNLNRSAFHQFIPELNKKIPMPNHFWRHMFFQHMLRATDWNYGASAQLGGSTVKSLEESYGLPPRAVVKKWGLKYLPQL